MRQKLFKKYFLATATIILVSLTVIMLILSFFYNRYLAQEKCKSLEKACDGISDYIKAAPNDERINAPDRGLYYIMLNVVKISDYDVFITDKSGRIMACVCDDSSDDGRCGHIGLVIPKAKIKSALSLNDTSLNTLGVYSLPRYVAAKEFVTHDNQQGYIVASASADGILHLVKKVSKIYLFSAIIPLILMFFSIYAITYRMTRPLKLMSQAAHAMAKGDFSKRIPVTSDDEIGELAVSFNQMTNSLARLEETRKDFVANVSHELKTPMTSIGGFIDGIIDGTIPADKQNYYLGIVSDEVKRLSRMVESMLNISRLESSEFNLKISEFDFRELIISAVISQEQRIEAKKFEISGLDTIKSVIIKADKDLIYRAIYNLIDNAIKFTDEGGKITFEVTVSSKQVVFKITNTGAGIAKSELPYVFERFYKGDKSRSAVKSSTGLGLYLVKTIVKNHGGNITVASVENQFTAFEVTLPR